MFKLNNEADLEKLKALISGQYTGQIIVAKELIEVLVAKLKAVAADMGISFRYRENPSDDLLLISMASGGLIGGVLGGAVAGLPGALIGGGIGAIAGLYSTKIEIVFDEPTAMYKMFIQS